jgi:hypothetical protein
MKWSIYVLCVIILITLTGAVYYKQGKLTTKWLHTHHSFRLEVLKDSLEVTGKVVKIEKCTDGDLDIELQVSPSNYNLLSERNFSVRDSCLVLEIVCVNKTFLSACDCYENDIDIPKVNDVIVVQGSYIWDRIHRWTEIHPVEHLKILSHTDIYY